MVYYVFKKNGMKYCRRVVDMEDYKAICNSAENIKNWEEYRRTGDPKSKKALVEMSYNCVVPDGGLLKGVEAISDTFFYDIDCGNKDECEKIKRLFVERKNELGLLEVSESANYGVHVVAMREREKTILECQVRLSVATKTEMDTNNKNVNRVVFHGPINDETTPLLDERLFSLSLSDEEANEEFLRLKEREEQGQENVPAEAKKANKHYRPWEVDVMEKEPVELETANGEPMSRAFPDEYKGFSYKEIIAKYWELFNDGKEPTIGDRDTLTYQLACDLRHICDKNAVWLDQVIPCYDGFPLEEKRQKIKSALQAKTDGLSYRMRRVLEALKNTYGIKACGGTMTSPPPMPKKLPALIKLLTKNVPDIYKAAVASSVFPALGAHMHGVKFRYWDNVDHEATFMNVLIGRQSVGKGVIKKPIEYIMDDIKQRDIPSRQREAEWKQKNPSAKQKKDPRPTDICIQMLTDNLTDAVFNQRIVDVNENGERYLFSCVDEIEALKKMTSKGTPEEIGLLIRKAFDNSESGQERVGADSVSGKAPLRWNFNASTTPPNARRFFDKMVNDGTISRLDVATIIRNDDDDEPPIMGIYDETYATALSPYIERLNAANGMINCAKANRLSKLLSREVDDMARQFDSEAYKVLGYRANVIAWLKGMVLYIAHECKWNKAIEDFMAWSLKYNLWCKMLYFGQQLEKELKEEKDIQNQSGPKNLLEELDNEFTKNDYLLMRQRLGRSYDNCATLRKWVSRGYVYKDNASGLYVKSEKYKKMI